MVYLQESILHIALFKQNPIQVKNLIRRNFLQAINGKGAFRNSSYAQRPTADRNFRNT